MCKSFWFYSLLRYIKNSLFIKIKCIFLLFFLHHSSGKTTDGYDDWYSVQLFEYIYIFFRKLEICLWCSVCLHGRYTQIYSDFSLIMYITSKKISEYNQCFNVHVNILTEKEDKRKKINECTSKMLWRRWM